MIPYCGYSQEISQSNVQRIQTHKKLHELSIKIKKHSNHVGVEDVNNWTLLDETLTNIKDLVYLEDNNTNNSNIIVSNIKQYQIIIINDAIIPYISQMTGRMVLEQKRFRQIIDLISIVFHDSNHKPIPIGVDNIYMNINTSNIRTQSHTTQHTQHPSFILNHVDELICEINNEGGFWKSELSKLLTNTSNVLWRPILIDMKVSVTSISSKLIVVGLVDMIGKPLLMLYPVWML